MDKRALLDRLAANGDERLLLGRVWDKYEQCRRRNIPVVTGFLSPAEQELVLGGEACMWAETVDVSDLYNTVWPRAGAFAERYWSPREVNDVDAAHGRYMHFRCLLNKRGVPAAPANNERGRSAPSGPGSCYAQ